MKTFLIAYLICIALGLLYLGWLTLEMWLDDSIFDD